MQSRLYPDSTLFLGDLFDGGREWATAESSSPEEQYKKYGTNFWLKEYRRFSVLFLQGWAHGFQSSRAAPFGRRIIASVPGNHDLGFASGIQPAVKSRFDAFFGPLNRVDVLGNHSVVSLDSVSLSAMDQVDPKTGSSGAGDGSGDTSANEHIWKPVEDFLVKTKSLRQHAVQREAISMTLAPPRSLRAPLSPNLLELSDDSGSSPHPRPSVPSALFPTILLTHVPLFRQANTPCGPFRDGNPSISLSQGYQYQNVLTPLISSDIIKHLSASEVVQIYSGDDHDYCEIEHSEFTGRIREITVKSTSWAMGIRKPGVQLVSLWNPIDASKLSIPNDDISTPKDTIQNHLCLLPDQLSIFIHYLQILILSLIFLTAAAIRYNPRAASAHHDESSTPLLPLANVNGHTEPKPSASASSSFSDNERLNPRSKLGGYGNLPAASRSSSPAKDPFAPSAGSHLIEKVTNAWQNNDENSKDSDDWAMPSNSKRRKGRIGKGGPPRSRFRYFTRSLWEVAIPVFGFYAWLLWNG